MASYVNADGEHVSLDNLRGAPVGFILFEEGRSKWLAEKVCPQDETPFCWTVNSENAEAKTYEEMISWVTMGGASQPKGPKTYLTIESLAEVRQDILLLSATGTVWLVLDSHEIIAAVNTAERIPIEVLPGSEFPMVDVSDTLRAMVPQRPGPRKPSVAERIAEIEALIESATDANSLPWANDGFRNLVDRQGGTIARHLADDEVDLIATAVNLLPKMLAFVEAVMHDHSNAGGPCAICVLEKWPCEQYKAAEAIFS